MKMNLLNRKIHLYSGLGLLSFVVMYFFTGFVMIHPGIFPAQDPVITSWSEKLDYQGSDDPEAWSDFLQRRFALRAQPDLSRQLEDGRVRCLYQRPGVQFEAFVSADRQTVEIKRTDWDFKRLMIGYHRVKGYNGSWLYYLWSFMYDLASTACIVFAVTGILIWYPTRRRDRLGWLFLGTGFGLTLATTLYLMYAP